LSGTETKVVMVFVGLAALGLMEVITLSTT
jgi:hypothetical protein